MGLNKKVFIIVVSIGLIFLGVEGYDGKNGVISETKVKTLTSTSVIEAKGEKSNQLEILAAPVSVTEISKVPTEESANVSGKVVQAPLQTSAPKATISDEAEKTKGQVVVKTTPTPTPTQQPAPSAPLLKPAPASTAPATIITTPIKAAVSTNKEILGFATYYYSGDSSSYNSLVANSKYINDIATDTYTTDGTGNISGLVPINQINYANSLGIKTYAMITNSFNGNIAKALLENPTNRQNLINNILSALKSRGFKGVNVDLEGIFYYDRSYYTAFMKELYSALHSKGFIVTASIPAKTYDNPNNGWSGAFDYIAIGQNSDRVALMTYDEHEPSSAAGTIASIGWVQNVVNYAVSVISRGKLLLGTAAYGYDWSSAGAKAYGIDDVNRLASTQGAQIKWDSNYKSPYFNYKDANGISHTVWFENGTSLSYKLDIVNNCNLAGIAIWRLGFDNNDYWTSIKNKFN
jgi:spore germination protein YaaH